MALDYSALSVEELEREIEREEGELERLKGVLSTKRMRLLHLTRDREAARSRYLYWLEQRRLARAETTELRRQVSRVLRRIRSLEGRLSRLEALLFPSVVDRAEMVSLRSEIRDGWREWAEIMNKLRLEVRPRFREADARYRRELRGFRRLAEEVRVLREDIDREEDEREAIEREIEEKKKFLKVVCRVWEVTRYYEYPLPPAEPARWQDKRKFQVVVYLPFLEGWDERDVEKYEGDIEDLCDEAMENGLKDIWDALRDLLTPHSLGYEPSKDTVEFTVEEAERPVSVEYKIVDMTEHYRESPWEGRKDWDIPKE